MKRKKKKANSGTTLLISAAPKWPKVLIAVYILCCDLNSPSFSLCFPLVTLIIRHTQVDLSFTKSCFHMQPVRHLKGSGYIFLASRAVTLI